MSRTLFSGPFLVHSSTPTLTRVYTRVPSTVTSTPAYIPVYAPLSYPPLRLSLGTALKLAGGDMDLGDCAATSLGTSPNGTMGCTVQSSQMPMPSTFGSPVSLGSSKAYPLGMAQEQNIPPSSATVGYNGIMAPSMAAMDTSATKRAKTS